MWGWGMLYALSKVTKYKKMLLGAFGCLGMLVFHLYEGLNTLPNELFIIFPNFADSVAFKNQILSSWENTGLSVYNTSFVLLFQICVVAALTGRFKSEQKLAEVEQTVIDDISRDIASQISRDGTDNDLDDYDSSENYVAEEYPSEEYASDSQEYHSEEYATDSQEYHSEEYATDSQEYHSEEYTTDSQEHVEEYDATDSQEYESEESEYIEAYTESQLSDEVEEYIPVGSISDANSSVSSVSPVSSADIENSDTNIPSIDDIPLAQGSAGEIQADELLDEYDEEVARSETFAEPVSIPLEPKDDLDFTISTKSDAFEPINSTQVAIPISDDSSSSMQESKEIAIPASPPEDEEIEATLACNMDEIIQDDDLPGYDDQKDETFANLGKKKTNSKNSKDDDEDDDKRSLLRNLLPNK